MTHNVYILTKSKQYKVEFKINITHLKNGI